MVKSSVKNSKHFVNILALKDVKLPTPKLWVHIIIFFQRVHCDKMEVGQSNFTVRKFDKNILSQVVKVNIHRENSYWQHAPLI